MAEIIAENPETGERITLVNGRWTPASEAPAAAGSSQDRMALAAAMAKAQGARETADAAGQFVAVNRNTGTGGPGAGLLNDNGPVGSIARGVASLAMPNTRSNMATMQALTSRMVRGQIQPGTSGAGNSDAEQRTMRQTFPDVSNPGPTNVTLARELALAAQVAEARAAAMDAYVKRNGSLNGFDMEWAQQERALRSQGPAPWAPAAPRKPQQAQQGGIVDLGVIR